MMISPVSTVRVGRGAWAVYTPAGIELGSPTGRPGGTPRGAPSGARCADRPVSALGSAALGGGGDAHLRAGAGEDPFEVPAEREHDDHDQRRDPGDEKAVLDGRSAALGLRALASVGVDCAVEHRPWFPS